jgi:predicted nucleotidyltransferase
MKNPIEKLFGSRIRARLLGWFFTHTGESFFVRQLASILKEDPTNLSREMANLERLGILKSTRQGNLKHFQANPGCPFFEEMKGLVLKTNGVAGQLKEAMDILAGIEIAFIYGSYARGEEQTDSDVDMLIIGDVDMDLLDTSIGNLEISLGRSINYVIYTMEEFESKLRARDGFIHDVLGGQKIMLIGKEDGFGKT